MKRLGILLLFGAILLPAPARAFVLQSYDDNGTLYHPRWGKTSLPVRFKMNDRPLELLPNIGRSSSPLPAIQAAMQRWALGPVGITLDGSSASADVARDGVNLITFVDSPKNRDATSNFWAITQIWYRWRGSELQIAETDVIMNPRMGFTTSQSETAGDVQSIVTHELGHALGLAHSPNIAATMYPGIGAGQTSLRTLEPDDIGAIRQLYVDDTGPDFGAVSGSVLTTGGGPVFGAHVTATDADGITQVGALTDWDGNFTIPSLHPGAYRLYAEPLDGPVTPADLNDDYFHDSAHPVLRQFRTTFAGGNTTSATVKVEAEMTTVIDPIAVDTQHPGFDPAAFFWTEDFETFRPWLAPLRLGQALYLIVVGPGIEKVPSAGFTPSAPNIGLNPGDVERGAFNDGTPYVILPLWLGTSARPGARNLYVTSGGERGVLTGVIEMPAP